MSGSDPDMDPEMDSNPNSDWLIESWLYVPLDTEQVISETFPQANLLARYGKKLNPIKRNVLEHKINTKN